MNPAKARSDHSGKEIPLSDGVFVASVATSQWYFVATDEVKAEGEYAVPVSALLKSPEAFIDWMAHLQEKPWFDGASFLEFFMRLRSRAHIYGAM